MKRTGEGSEIQEKSGGRERAQGKSSRSQVSGGGHCYVTKLFLFNPKSQQF